MKRKRYGSAIYAALQLIQLPMGKIDNAIRNCKIHAIFGGADIGLWMDDFWATVGIAVAQYEALKFKKGGGRKSDGRN